MAQSFAEMLLAGGKTNSLGRVNEVIDIVANDASRLGELFDCLFDDDAWVRMRAVDALEKICRKHPDWIEPYIDQLQKDFHTHSQPSIQWHLSQIYGQVSLTEVQRSSAINWLQGRLSTTGVDWIVAAYAMDTLFKFTRQGFFSQTNMTKILRIQQNHRSKSVVRKATKLLDGLATSLDP